MKIPSRSATYYYKLKLPPSSSGDAEVVEWDTLSAIDMCAHDEDLATAAKAEFLEWCERNLDIKVETNLDGTVAELATSYEERLRAASAIAANSLCSGNSSEFSASLRRILKFLSPSSLEHLEDGTYQVGDLGDEPRLAGDESRRD